MQCFDNKKKIEIVLRLICSNYNFLFVKYNIQKVLKKSKSTNNLNNNHAMFVLVMYQKRLKKERKQRQQIQDQLDAELKRRQKIEEALKQSGAPQEILRIVTGKTPFTAYIKCSDFKSPTINLTNKFGINIL